MMDFGGVVTLYEFVSAVSVNNKPKQGHVPLPLGNWILPKGVYSSKWTKRFPCKPNSLLWKPTERQFGMKRAALWKGYLGGNALCAGQTHGNI
jgi:hypothetical protein